MGRKKASFASRPWLGYLLEKLGHVLLLLGQVGGAVLVAGQIKDALLGLPARPHRVGQPLLHPLDDALGLGARNLDRKSVV